MELDIAMQIRSYLISRRDNARAYREQLEFEGKSKRNRDELLKVNQELMTLQDIIRYAERLLVEATN